MTSFAETAVKFSAFVDQFTEAMGNAVTAIRRFKSAYAASRLDLQPSERYMLAGYPFGKTTPGKKRWLLEQKRRQRP